MTVLHRRQRSDDRKGPEVINATSYLSVLSVSDIVPQLISHNPKANTYSICSACGKDLSHLAVSSFIYIEIYGYMESKT